MHTHHNRLPGVSVAIIGAALVLTSPAFAQDSEAPQADDGGAAATLFSCRTIAEDSVRLACYDREVGALQAAEASDKVVIVEQEDIRNARRDLFGFTLPRIKLFKTRGDEAAEEEEIKEVEMPLANIRIEPTGRVVFTLINGARWMQIDNVPVLGRPKSGDVVRIERASLGSFKASIGGRRAIRVKRVN